MNTVRKAKIKSSGIIVEVYKLTSGDWCNYSDCKTVYKEVDLQFIN